jgi:hypothetical protein
MMARQAALLRACLLCAVGAQCLGTSGGGGGGPVSAQQAGLSLAVQARPWDLARSALVSVLDARPLASSAAQHALAAHAVPRRLLQPNQGSAAAGGVLWPAQLPGRLAGRASNTAVARRLLQGPPAAAPAVSLPAYLLVVMEVRP